MALPTKVKMVEVGARDGLQNEPQNIPTAVKIDFINRLAHTGLPVIEATSFVSPKWIPQMSDHVEIMGSLPHVKGVSYPALVPNLKGLDTALAVGVKEIAVFAAASDTFSKKNTNASITESLQRIENVITQAKAHDVKVRGYVSCVLGCPYEGDINLHDVLIVSKALYELGCYEISLGDTIGVGTPGKAQQLIETVAKDIPIEHLAVHFHDTYGQALANIFACLQLGVATVDSSVAGLGGCPYAPGASGNVASEDVLYMLNGLNIATGVDINKLIDAGAFICNVLKKPTRSKVAQAFA